MDKSEKTDKQRINLIVEAKHLALFVPREEEELYRRAGAYINNRIEAYRNKYPNSHLLPVGAYHAMASIDAAYHYLKSAREADCEPLFESVAAMNDDIESFILEHRL